jgi:hypothetical protein
MLFWRNPYFAKKQEVKKIFEIGNNTGGAGEIVLLVEWGQDFCCLAHFNKTDNEISWLQYFTYDINDTNALQHIIDSVAANDYATAAISTALPYALLTPFVYAENATVALNALFEEHNNEVFKDRINEWQIINIWSMPAGAVKLFNSLSKSLQVMHAYTPAIKMYNGFSSGDQVSIHFTPGNFRVLVKKNGTIQLVQMYDYKTPLDVVYYLLKIADAFGLAQNEALLVVSGLIEEDSALYKELLHYFSNIHFTQAPSVRLPENDFPQHYFTSMYNLAACVS